VLNITYYDNYTGLDVQEMDMMPDGFTGEQYANATGNVTCTVTKILSGDVNDWDAVYNFYDDRNRLIQAKSFYTIGNVEIEEVASSEYDFIGRVTKTHTHQLLKEDETVVSSVDILDELEYDHAGRLVRTWQTISNGVNTPERVLVSEMQYNELGQLIDKKLHNSIAQSIDYKYNIRGWLTHINNTALDDGEDDVFGMELFYNEVDELNSLNCQANFNGNIGGMAWTSINVEDNIPYTRAYGYQYDNLDRLTGADFGEYISGTWENPVDKYDMSVGEYDKNGNIKKLIRYGENGLIDNLTYTYLGNRLMSVNDNDADDNAGFKELTETGNEYWYDANGNMNKDNNKGITNIDYNFLNLPQSVDMTEGNVSYIYDASGMKLVHTNPVGDEEYYIGNFVYEKTGTNPVNLSYLLFSEGRVVTSTGAIDYEYHVKDHLGNTRVAISSNGEIKQISEYYPFGMRFIPIEKEDGDQNYLYNGKEYQDGLDWYDFKWRFYDPALGRFFTQDRLAEKFAYMSPYQFCSNNPIWLKELDGLEGIKYTDADGVKTIEKNVVVLTEQHKDIPKGATQKQVDRITRQNKNIDTRNAEKVSTVTNQLNAVYGNAKNSSGEQVNFKFNITTKAVDNPTKADFSQARQIGNANGIKSSTMAIDGKTPLTAPAAVITDINSTMPGLCTGNIMVEASTQDNAIAHETGHTLLTTGQNEDTFPNGAVMNYPAQGYVSRDEVDLMWNQAYDK